MANSTKFNDSLKAIILRLASKGQTDQEIADTIGVCRKTLYNWKGKYPDFARALDDSKDVADDLVEASLFSRAMGYSHPETKIHFTKEGEILEAVVQKHYAPDVVACIFWLKNRKPHEWRDRVEHAVEKDASITLNYNLDDDKKAS